MVALRVPAVQWFRLWDWLWARLSCRVGAGSTCGGWAFGSLGQGMALGSGERGADLVPCLGGLFCPPPGVVDPESGLPGAVADPGGGVQHPVPNVAISQVARSGSSVKPMSLDQATRSIAVITISSQALLAA